MRGPHVAFHSDARLLEVHVTAIISSASEALSRMPKLKKVLIGNVLFPQFQRLRTPHQARFKVPILAMYPHSRLRLGQVVGSANSYYIITAALSAIARPDICLSIAMNLSNTGLDAFRATKFTLQILKIHADIFIYRLTDNANGLLSHHLDSLELRFDADVDRYINGEDQNFPLPTGTLRSLTLLDHCLP